MSDSSGRRSKSGLNEAGGGRLDPNPLWSDQVTGTPCPPTPSPPHATANRRAAGMPRQRSAPQRREAAEKQVSGTRLARPDQNSQADLPFSAATAGPEAAAEPGHLGHRARMRTKLITAGPDALLDHELLEMILYLALPRRDTKPLARELIARFGSYAAAIAAPSTELLQVEGLGAAGLAALKTVHGAALRLARAEVQSLPLLNNWDRLLDYLSAAIARERVEQFRVLFLDSKNRLIADEAQARGTVNHTPVYPREVVRRALELQATALILVHNHPSGDPTPSRADIEMTAEVKSAAGALGIAVHDHLIIGNGRHVSLRREGLM